MMLKGVGGRLGQWSAPRVEGFFRSQSIALPEDRLPYVLAFAMGLGFGPGTCGVPRTLAAAPVETIILTEDFEDAVTPGLVLPNQRTDDCSAAAPAGVNSACVTRVLDGPGRLYLTGAFNDQLGYAWLEEPIDLSNSQVRVEFDFFIFGGTNPPADGLSLIFLPAAKPEILTKGGGSLGTGGLDRPYLSIAVDLWDNGDIDPETPCDGASSRTCHVEVNSGTDPGLEPSLLTSALVPSFAAAGNAGQPVHLDVLINGGELAVRLSTPFQDYGTQEVIRTLLPPGILGGGEDSVFVGVAASTGSANAFQAIDDLSVRASPIAPPVLAWDTPATRGGINCGGPTLTLEVDGEETVFASDQPYGEISSIEVGSPTVFRLRGAGHAPDYGGHGASFPGPIEGLSHPELEPLFLSEAWSQCRLEYRVRVPAGRYAIKLYTAENCPCGMDAQGRATRRYDVMVQGQFALRRFSPAEAAASDRDACWPLLSTAVERTFEADAFPIDAETSLLEVIVLDLGGGTPPENAQLNAISYVRIGAPSGQPLSGDVEDHRAPTDMTFDPLATFAELHFDGIADRTPAATALEGIAKVNWGGPGPVQLQFQPIIWGGRLRLVDDSRLATATSVLFYKNGSLVFDPRDVRLEAEFDLFVANGPGGAPADGVVFGIAAGDNPRLLGTAGGALGFAGLSTAALGVEVDFWEGGGAGDDSGYNTDGQGHMAVIGSGAGPATVDHVQDQNDYDPSLDASTGGWVDFLAHAGFHVEIAYTPGAHVEAYLTARDGTFPRRKVLDALVTPFESPRAMAGFFAATGGETATVEVDNVVIRTAPCQDAAERAVIAGEPFVRLTLAGEGDEVVLDVDGSSSSSGDGDAPMAMTYRWTLDGPEGGASIAAPCHAATSVTFSQPGDYVVTLSVDDRRCAPSPEGTAKLLVRVRPEGDPTFLRGDSNCDGHADLSDAITTLAALFLGEGGLCCEDAADSNDDASIDISDPIQLLNFFFLGGPSPAPPFPDCGPDPATVDPYGCEAVSPCR